MLYPRKLVTRPQLNLGVLAVLSLVFLVSVVVVPTDLDRELTVTCVGPDVCSLLPRPGGNGTDVSTER